MKIIPVRISGSTQSYPIVIGTNILSTFSDYFTVTKYTKIAIISDDHVPRSWISQLSGGLKKNTYPIIIPAGEQYKTIDTVIMIWEQLLYHTFDRTSVVINLGGGVVGDIGGFAASTFMRGIDFIQVPTTITAQVDAMIGGKLGINFKDYKNYIGAFQQPRGVLIDITPLTTLSKQVFLEGFSEIIKHGLIFDKDYFSFVTSKNPLSFTRDELLHIITRSVEIKKNIVEQDEHEFGIRKILNFGHTIGHAIESLSLKTTIPLLHGEAILLGMIVETKISQLLALLSDSETHIILKKLRDTDLPHTATNVTKQAIMKELSFDKKVSHGTINWTLLSHIGSAMINQQVPEEVILTALREIIT